MRKEAVEDRYRIATTLAHFLANVTNPQFKRESLTVDETVKEEIGSFAATLSWTSSYNYKVKSSPFSSYIYDGIDRINLPEKKINVSYKP